MIELPPKWAPVLVNAPETGMGYTVCNVELKDGRVFERVVIVGGTVTRCDGSKDIPFAADEITGIIPTHDKSAL
jgi:hypothetical protein